MPLYINLRFCLAIFNKLLPDEIPITTEPRFALLLRPSSPSCFFINAVSHPFKDSSCYLEYHFEQPVFISSSESIPTIWQFIPAFLNSRELSTSLAGCWCR